MPREARAPRDEAPSAPGEAEPARDTKNIQRVVVKLGTNTLCDPTGRPDEELLRALAEEIHLLRSHGRQFLIVSSGAIGCGRALLRMPELPQEVAQRQALAAIGQHRLMAAWDEALARHKAHAAQVLVTHRTFDRRSSYLHLRACLEALLSMQAVPILNENDAVSIAEIDDSFGDNDVLGALIAAKVDADLYIILSDVPCLYTKPPHVPGAQPVHYVERVDDAVLAMADGRTSKNGRGGMLSKLTCAKQLTEAGVPVVIAYGREPGILSRILAGEEIGTWFERVGHRDGRERWILAARPQGKIKVDKGALEALRAGNHLLPAGIRGVEGDFPVESVVEIVLDGRAVGRAVAQFSSSDLAVCQGLQSEAARKALGIAGSVNVTRKGRLVLL